MAASTISWEVLSMSSCLTLLAVLCKIPIAIRASPAAMSVVHSNCSRVSTCSLSPHRTQSSRVDTDLSSLHVLKRTQVAAWSRETSRFLFDGAQSVPRWMSRLVLPLLGGSLAVLFWRSTSSWRIVSWLSISSIDDMPTIVGHYRLNFVDGIR